MRSLLFVPADSPRKLAKAMDLGADALILDLEDSVPREAKQTARANARAFLADAGAAASRPHLMLRVNSFESGLADADLSIVCAELAAIVLPKSTCGADVQRLGVKLAVAEAERGLEDGRTRVLPIASESGAAIFGLGSYPGCSKRLLGLAWGAEDLSADIGAESNRDAKGDLTGPFQLARNLVLMAAAAAQVGAWDGPALALRNADGLRKECAMARRDGFIGKLAIHPAQIAIINEVFTPSAEALARAQRIIDAFAASPGSGAIALDGEMVDAPHVKRAERLLRRAASLGRLG